MKKYKLIRNYPGFNVPSFANEVREGIFIINDDDIYTEYFEDYFTLYPEFWQKMEAPLFKTADNVVLHNENDVVCPVIISEYKILSERKIKGIDFTCLESCDLLFYSSLESAQKWVDENKPIYSKKQILNAIEDSEYADFRIYTTKLLEKLGL